MKKGVECEHTAWVFHLVKWKGGASHIEIILAFILFVSVVGFALYFLNPVNPDRLTDVTMDYIYREITKNVSVGVESFSVQITGVGNNWIGVDVGGIDSRKERVESDNGQIDSKVNVDLIDVNISGLSINDFVFIKLSEDLDGGSFISSGTEGTYKIASSNYEEVFSEKRMRGLNDSYYGNYSGLKDYFNIPDRTDFGFEFIFDNGDVIKSERKIPLGLEVFSERKRVEVLDSGGSMVFADFVIRLW